MSPKEAAVADGLHRIRSAGYQAEQLNPWHLRVTDPRGGYVDWWPTKGTFIAQPSGIRGCGWKSLGLFLRGEGRFNGEQMIVEIDEEPGAPPW